MASSAGLSALAVARGARLGVPVARMFGFAGRERLRFWRCRNRRCRRCRSVPRSELRRMFECLRDKLDQRRGKKGLRQCRDDVLVALSGRCHLRHVPRHHDDRNARGVLVGEQEPTNFVAVLTRQTVIKQHEIGLCRSDAAKAIRRIDGGFDLQIQHPRFSASPRRKLAASRCRRRRRSFASVLNERRDR